MIRLIKRYGSRKLYDTEESRYVSLEEIGNWVRQGQEIKVQDNKSGDDVTAQTLTQVILEDGRRGTSFPPAELLHEMIRRGEELVSNGVGSVRQSVDRLVKVSIDRLAPVRQVREETSVLRQRLEELEATLARLEREPAVSEAAVADEPAVQSKENE